MFIVYYLTSLETLDGNIINNQLKQKANKKHGGPSPETWAVRENLVSFRRNLADKNIEKKENEEQILLIQNKIKNIKIEIETIDKTIEKNRTEL